MKRHNLHNHTTYSDGKLTLNDMSSLAQTEGISILGITDHVFTHKLPVCYQVTSRIPEYLDAIRNITSPPHVQIMAGMEIDVSTNTGTSPAELPIHLLNQFDYLLFEYATLGSQTPPWFHSDLYLLAACRSTFSVPVGLAHPDLQLISQGREEETCKLLADADIFLDINQSEIYYPPDSYTSKGAEPSGRNTRDGMDYYQHFSPLLLEAMVKHGVSCVIGTDTHQGYGFKTEQNPQGFVLNHIDDAIAFIQKNNLRLHPLVQ